MFKYAVAAMTLKAFSWSPSTMRLYRDLGNKVGAKKRATGVMPNYYFERVKRMLALHKKHRFVKDGDRLLELGTGWLHWEAITCALFFDIQGVLFDVWDNRQLSGLQNYMAQFDKMLDRLDTTEVDLDRAHRLIREIKKAKGFDELYKALRFEYVVDPTGRLTQLEKGSFDVIVSGGVLEHINRDSAAALVNDIAVVLKPGGFSCHSIQIGDHLYAYDMSVSAKQYLRYSDTTWKRWFENDVQYINRLQRSDWLDFFQKSALVLLEEEVAVEDLSGMKVAEIYRHYPEIDLQCSNLKVLHSKPR
jgi:SAM-dependent methyltransferase